MFTKNWYKGLFGKMVTGSAVSAIATDGTANAASYAYMTKSSTEKQTNCPLGCIQTSDITRYGGVAFGTGTTPPTLDDYCLSGDMIAGIVASCVFQENSDDSGCTLTMVYTIVNNNSSEITIGEVAAFCGSGGSTKGFMLERTMLDSPVTIPAGGVGQVTYTIRMNYPT